MSDWVQTITIIVSVIVPVIGVISGIVLYTNRQTNKRIDDFRSDVDKRLDDIPKQFAEIRADIRLILNKLIPEGKIRINLGAIIITPKERAANHVDCPSVFTSGEQVALFARSQTHGACLRLPVYKNRHQMPRLCRCYPYHSNRQLLRYLCICLKVVVLS